LASPTTQHYRQVGYLCRTLANSSLLANGFTNLPP